jgi:hypothetical protein
MHATNFAQLKTTVTFRYHAVAFLQEKSQSLGFSPSSFNSFFVLSLFDQAVFNVFVIPM